MARQSARRRRGRSALPRPMRWGGRPPISCTRTHRARRRARRSFAQLMRAPSRDRPMRIAGRLRPALLRWDRLLAVSALTLPFLVAMLAGFAWMFEHGWFVTFIVASIGFSGVVGLIRLATFW